MLKIPGKAPQSPIQEQRICLGLFPSSGTPTARCPLPPRVPSQHTHPGDEQGPKSRPRLFIGQIVERLPWISGAYKVPAAPRPTQRPCPFRPYLTFSCQGSFRATADGSSGSLLKDVGVCASCSESRRLQDRAVKQRNPLLREKVAPPHAPKASSSQSTLQSSRVHPKRQPRATSTPSPAGEMPAAEQGGGCTSPERLSHCPEFAQPLLNPCRCFFSRNLTEKFRTSPFFHLNAPPTPIQPLPGLLSPRQPHLMSPAAMNTGSRLSWLVMLSTENWEMLSQLLV